MPSDQDAPDADFESNADRLPWRWLFVAGFLGVCLAVTLSVIIFSAISHPEKLPEITMDVVNAAAARWTTNHPDNYDMAIDQTGVNAGNYHVQVRKGEVTSVTLNDHPIKEHSWDNWSVPGLFEIIRRDVESCMPKLNAEAQEREPTGQAPPIVPRGLFDPHDGHPLEYHRITPMGADVRWKVSKFESK